MKREEYLSAVKLLKDADNAYYNGSKELMSNKEYDELRDQVSVYELENPDNLGYTNTVGHESSKILSKVTHEYPALSLDKTKDVDVLASEFRKGAKACNGDSVVFMWKMDGGTAVATYADGKLIRLATRGNGEIGSDITHNAPYIEGLPLEIAYKGNLTVRGEIVMSYPDFDKINANLPDDEKFANPRNLANATASCLPKSVEDIKNRPLKFFAFTVITDAGITNVNWKNNPFSTTLEKMSDKTEMVVVPYRFDGFQLNYFSERLRFAYILGFNVVPYLLYHVDDIEDAIEEWTNDAAKYVYPVDGLVVALNFAAYADILPGTGHHPNHMVGMAFKWADETAETVLRDIEWSASRTGLLNPVAVFDPVELCGTTVSRASLHNLSYIVDKDLRIGDTITVYKANMIIPQVDKNLSAKERENKVKIMQDYISIKKCPICGGDLSIHTSEDGNVQSLYCSDITCPAKKIGAFVHFCERDCMNIEGMSEATITKFVEKGFLKYLSDIFKLERFKEDIEKMEGFGSKSYTNLINAVNAAKTTDFVSFLHSLGIPNVGKGQAKIIKPLAEKYMQEINQVETEMPVNNLWETFADLIIKDFDFSQLEGIGPVINKRIYDSWVATDIKEFCGYIGETSELEDILSFLTFTDTVETTANTLNGLTFVITGSLNHFNNRDELVSVIEKNGGKVSGSVSKNTSYLINNDVTSTSGKNKKAQELSVPIISEEDFLKMI